MPEIILGLNWVVEVGGRGCGLRGGMCVCVVGECERV